MTDADIDAIIGAAAGALARGIGLAATSDV
jgi:hypothetical protein